MTTNKTPAHKTPAKNSPEKKAPVKTAKKTAAKKKAAKVTASQDAAPKIAHFADFQTLKSVQPTQAMESMMTKSKEQFEKLSNEASVVGKEGLDALMKSGSIFMKGYEDILKTYMGLAQKTAEKNGEAFKTLLSCKTVNEFVAVQSRLTQQGIDDFMTGTTRLSELSVKLASDGFAPINDQMGKAIKKAGDAMAA